MGLVEDVFGIKTDKKSNTAFQLPIIYLDDYIKGTDNKYKLIARVAPVNAELMDVPDIEAVCEAIHNAMASYDGRLQILVQSERVNIDKNIDHIEKKKQTLNHELKLELIEESKKHLSSMRNKSRNVPKFYFAIESKEKNYTAATQVLDTYYSSIRSELESQAMYTEKLNKQGILRLLYERLNPDSSQSEPLQEHWEIENIMPECAIRFQDGRHLQIENYFYRHYAITNIPQTVPKHRWLSNIFKFEGTFFVSIIMTPKSKVTIQDELSKAIRKYRTLKNEAEGRDEKLRIDYENKEESANKMLQQIGADNISLYDTNITIGISAQDKKELHIQAAKLRSKIASTLCQSTEIKYKDFMPFFNTLPILPENNLTNNWVWNLTSKDIASLCIFDSSEMMEPQGTLIGENITSRGLVIVDRFSRIYNNPHVCILADSGAGKSFWIACSVIRELPYRDYIIQFDLDGSARYPWAEKYLFSPTTDTIINPFHIRNATLSSANEEGKTDVGSFLAIKIMDLITFFKWCVPQMTKFDEAILEEDIRDAYKEVGLDFESNLLPEKFPTMDTLIKVMEKKLEINDTYNTKKRKESRVNLISTLNPYVKGVYAKMFNGQSNWDYRTHTIFDLHMLPDAVKNPTYEILLKDTWQFVKKDGTLDKMSRPVLKNIIIDEAHLFADENNPQTLKFISTDLTKQSRKFGVSCITATQNIADLTSIKRYGQAIIDNSFFKILFRLGENDHELAKKLYRLSDTEMKIIDGSNSKTGTKGRGIFMAGSQKVLFQSIASKYELEIIDPAQYEEIYKRKSRFA